MNYIEVVFKNINKDNIDLLVFELEEIGFESYDETDNNCLKAYINSDNFCNNKIIEILSNNCLNKITHSHDTIKDQNWNKLWESNFDYLIVEDKCLIKAPFHKVEKKYQYEITIEPKMAFGTGHHETTYLMMKNILNINFLNKYVLDMGCGTAILGILASKRGASFIHAVDNDEWATNNAIENVVNNGANNVKIFFDTAKFISSGKAESLLSEYSKQYYDVIFANINKNVLLNDIPIYSKILNKNGHILLSGFYVEDNDDLLKVANDNDLYLEHTESNNKWSVLKLVKK